MSKLYVSQSNTAQWLYFVKDILFVLEKIERFINAQFEYIVNILFFISHLQHFFLELPAVANFAGKMYIGKKLHLDHLFTFTLTRITTASVDVKRKVLGLKAAHLTKCLPRIKIANLIISLDIGYRITA